MRIALFGPFPLQPLKFSGGIESSMWNLIQGLKELGESDLHVLTLNDTLENPLHQQCEGVNYYYLPNESRWHSVTGYGRARKSLLATLNHVKPDVVHAQDSQQYGYASLKVPYPLVVSVHGIVGEEAKYLVSYRNRIRALIFGRFIERRCVTESGHLIQPTRYPERYFSGLKGGVWHDTGNAVCPFFFSAKKNPRPGNLLYAGAVIRRKRIIDLIEALGILRKTNAEFVLRVAGPTPDRHYYSQVKARIAALGLQSHISFLGQLDPDEMRIEYGASELLILPSGSETSPMVITEAMATGTPVVATKVGGVLDLMIDGETGLAVEVGDVGGLVKAIKTLRQDAHLRSNMGQRARMKAYSDYRGVVVAAKVRDVYEQTISTHQR